MESAHFEGMGQERTRRALGILLGVLGVSVLIYPVLADREVAGNRGQGVSTSGTPVGTSGREPARSASIRELETITGMNDGHPLIGRTVDLDVPIQQRINDHAFWIGTDDNRVLVVRGRDTRRREPINVTGTVQGLPSPDAMVSWGLTNRDREELLQRRIFIRMDD